VQYRSVTSMGPILASPGFVTGDVDILSAVHVTCSDQESLLQVVVTDFLPISPGIQIWEFIKRRKPEENKTVRYRGKVQ